MSSDWSELTEEQKQKLQQFRSQVKDVLRETDDDYFLLRWLNARKWNIAAAERMLRASLKTRAMWNVDTLETWNAPKALQEYVPTGMVGFDKEGSPVIVCPFYNLDIYGVLHCATRFDFMRYVVLLLERYMKAGYEQSKIHGLRARQLVVLFDMKDFTIRAYTWRPAAELVLFLIKQYEKNYPEILKMCYIINAPKVFSVAFNVVKKFLDEYTISKINVYKYGCDNWKEDMFKHVDPDIVPKRLGGNCTENGDDKCPSKVVWGGKIPQELYLEQRDEIDGNKEFTEAVVANGNKLKLEFEVDSKNSNTKPPVLSWNFRTIDYGIRFGIYSTDTTTGERHSEIDLGNVQSNEMDEVGFIATRPNTKYTVVFDNTNSYLRSKKLRYWVSLIPELDDKDIEFVSQDIQSEVVAVNEAKT
ncbi:SEC14-like protein 2 [Glossina fuscipes]|uniref:SEC14-like protein 2 n=1 Tax=Glossina fuscipes TaxID=7396 RepID=A0A8U0W354_9MUSC|nr:SEC14-like protein 2 [Glossina fuscipes]